MTDLFSEAWMLCFQTEWNSDSELVKELAHIKFNSMIGYGFSREPHPRGVIKITKGKATAAGDYEGEVLNWDLRAEPNVWVDWFRNPPGMMALGMAYTSQKLKFKKGDYASMIKDPSIASPFIKSFIVMSQVSV